MKDFLFACLQYVTPQACLSRAAGWLAETRIGFIKDRLITVFIKQFDVDMSEAEITEPSQFPCFNDFFTRALKPGARTIADGADQIACPADGAISEIGPIFDGRIIQAKNHHYTVTELVGGDPELAQQFSDGLFATVYLSPKDYHRLHMPIDGTLKQMIHVPGDLFSVNQATADNVPRLFARNERVVCVFDTAAGPMVLVLVGAMIVASIETVWAGLVAPQRRQVRSWNYSGTSETITLKKGEEMGRFKLGSTIIVLLGKDAATFADDLTSGSPVRMGQVFGHLKN